jgi:hypothetical protein
MAMMSCNGLVAAVGSWQILCSLIPGLAVKLSTIILAGPTVLSAVGGTLRMMA